MRDREEWAEDHGYYHWKCRDCGMSGWTDTSPDCACPRCPCGKFLKEGDEGRCAKCEAEVPKCPKCGSADWNEEADEGAWPSCNDCGFVQYSAETLALQAEVQREQADCKQILGYVPTYQEAVKKGLIK